VCSSQRWSDHDGRFAAQDLRMHGATRGWLARRRYQPARLGHRADCALAELAHDQTTIRSFPALEQWQIVLWQTCRDGFWDVFRRCMARRQVERRKIKS
jgi:hypothetical protein